MLVKKEEELQKKDIFQFNPVGFYTDLDVSIGR